MNYKIGYEQTDRKILVDIYGLEFEVKKFNKELIDKFKSLKDEEINDYEELYKYVDLFLGEGASEKINAKRKADGYEEMNYENILAIIELVFKVQKDKFDSYENKYKKYGNRNYRRRRY